MPCPVCKAENNQGAKFCNECGIRLELRCPYCEAPSAAGAKFCSECGSNLDFRCLQCSSANRPGAKFCQACGVRLVTICFACHTPTPPGAKFCQECGIRLERRCGQCGSPLAYSAKFCNGCGGALEAAASVAVAPPPAPPAPLVVPIVPIAPVQRVIPTTQVTPIVPATRDVEPPPVAVPEAPEDEPLTVPVPETAELAILAPPDTLPDGPTAPIVPEELETDTLAPPDAPPERPAATPVPPPAARPEPVSGPAVATKAPPAPRETTAAVAAPARAPAVQKDERRLVTVLFGDVSGFTAMSESLDPEEVKQIMDRCLKTLADQVAKYQGSVDKFEGDLIMAVWGAPVAYEDDAERAVLAALGMQQELQKFAADLERRRGFSLKMRIGLNSGEVISGAVASGRQKDYTVMGDVVNTASRFEGAAEPGTVLVGAKTYILTRHMIEYEELEPITVKGKTERLKVYRPLGVRSDRGRRRGIEGLESPLVGRGTDLEELIQSFEDAVEHKTPQLVTIAGVPGIGKSRLVDEFQNYLTSLEYPVGWCKGRSLPYGQGITFHPLSEMLKTMFSINDSDPKQVVMDRLLDGVRHVLEQAEGGAVSSSALDEEAAQVAHRLGYAMGVSFPDSDYAEITPTNMKEELVWAWRRFFFYWASPQPGVIVVEDAHWADKVVLDLLQSLLEVLEGVPILILACTRPELIDQALGLVEGLNRHIIQLEPLDHDESVRLVDNLLSPNLLTRSWKDHVANAAGGVPFFLEEFVRGLVDEGRIVQGPTGWVPAQVENLPELPDTVFATLFARMDKLPTLERAVLQRASVIGSKFWDSALCYPAAQLGREANALLGLQAKNWVGQQNASSFVDDREYSFSNDLVRESAYKALTKSHRVGEHRRVAEWLESKVGDRVESFVALLAYHFAQGTLQAFGDDAAEPAVLAKAAAYCWQAAERARIEQAFMDALSRYDDTFSILDLLLNSADEISEADRSAAAGRQVDALVQRARVKEPLGQYQSALGDVEQALQLAEKLPEPALRAAGHTQKARILRLQGEGAAAADNAERAILLYQEAQDLLGQAQALINLGEVYSDQGRFTDLERSAQSAAALAEQCGVRWVQGRALALLGSACIYQGKMSEAGEHLRLAADRYQEIRDRRGMASTLLLLGRVLHAEGSSRDAIDRLEQAFTIFQELGDQVMRTAALTTLGQLYLERGQLEAARVNSERGATLAKLLGLTGQQLRCLLILSQAELAVGQAREAVDRLLEAKTTCESGDQAAILPEIYRMLGQAYLQAGEPEVAEEYARKGREAVEEDDTYSQGTTWFSLALVLAGLQRPDEAEEAFAQAMKYLEESEETYEIGEVHLEYGAFVLAQGRKDEAAEHLRKAQEAFAPLETQDRLDRVEALTKLL